jgi:hypothetical protein
MSTAELAVSYAALILADDGVEITVCQTLKNQFPVRPVQVQQEVEDDGSI